MGKTFTKIRKWAETNGYEVEERNVSRPAITVRVNKELSFDLDERESTIYHSIKGIRGNCAGLYISTQARPDGKWIRPHSFHIGTQGKAIEEMEAEINHYVHGVSRYNW
jgi:hypothetical protein